MPAVDRAGIVPKGGLCATRSVGATTMTCSHSSLYVFSGETRILDTQAKMKRILPKFHEEELIFANRTAPLEGLQHLETMLPPSLR